MKKTIKFILCGVAVCLALVVLVACNGAALATPTDIDVDEDNRLSWVAVEGARNYVVEIRNVQDADPYEPILTRYPYYSLAELEEGDYEIRIKAKGKNGTSDESEWTKVIEFHKNYTTGCIYTLINNNTEYEVTKAGTAKGTVVIEDVYKGKPVTAIADGAFRGRGAVTEIVLGKNVRYVGVNAFFSCSKLASVTLPESVSTIGTSAFMSCISLEKINIPSRITEIAEFAFSSCPQLKDINIDHIRIFGKNAFYGCTQLTSANLAAVVRLGESAFGQSGLTTVTFGKNLSYIGTSAFASCKNLAELKFADGIGSYSVGTSAFHSCESLKEVSFPEGLTSLGNMAFHSSGVEKITLPDSLTSVGTLAFTSSSLYKAAGEERFVYADKWIVGHNKTSDETISADMFKSDVAGIADRVFMSRTSLTDIELPASLKYIGASAFYMCKNLWHVKMNGVKEVGANAFSNCELLSFLELGQTVETISNYAFYQCSQLKNNSIEGNSIIPNSVKKIGTYAFKDTYMWNHPQANGLVMAGNWVVGYNADAATDVTSTIELPDTTRGISNYAFMDAERIQSITGVSYARYIGAGAFYGCSGLSAVSFNDNLAEIEGYTFYGCNSLLQIGDIPYNLTKIGKSAFYKCTQLVEVDLSASKIKEIGDFAFYGNTNVQTISLPRTLEKIGNYSFAHCERLRQVTIPDSVTEISGRAFAHCDMLASVNFGNGVEIIGDYAFNKCPITNISLPDSVKTVGRGAFYKSNPATIDLGNGVEEIGDFAFYNSVRLMQLTIPQSVRHIGSYAFRGASTMSYVYIPSEVKQIDEHAFYGCLSATFYTDADSVAEEWSTRWNSSYRPVVFNCALDENGQYVSAVSVQEGGVINHQAMGGIFPPVREGYTFVGWTADVYSSRLFAADEIFEVPAGTTVNSVWVEASEEEVQQ